MSIILTDFDGTIAPIRIKPNRVRISNAMLATLNQLHASKIRIIVLSGRPVNFLRRQLPAFVEIIPSRGNTNFSVNRKELNKLLKNLKLTLRGFTVSLEVKSIGVVVHYRLLNRTKVDLLENKLKYFCKKRNYSYIQGRKAVEITPLNLLDKADVVKKMSNLKDVIFFGDDDSDACAAREVVKFGGTAYLVNTNERKLTPKKVIYLNGIIQVRKVMQNLVKSTAYV